MNPSVVWDNGELSLYFTDPRNGLLKTPEAAKIIGISTMALRLRRNRGVGPRHIRVGQNVFYKPEAIEDYMNQNRRDQLVRGLPTLHKKVLDGVPMLQPMEKGKVCSEVIRASGTRIDQRTIYHVLGALRDQGLIREPSPNHFIQNAKKDKEEEDMAAVNKDRLPGPVTMILAPKPAPSPESDPLDRLSAVAEWLLTMAGEVSEIAKRVESDRAKGGSDSAKLRQLQALLKGE